MDVNIEKVRFMKESDVLSANGICQVYRDRFWIYCPARGLVFYTFQKRDGIREATPQCNSQEFITISLRDRMYPWAEVKFFPLVLKPININDYCS